MESKKRGKIAFGTAIAFHAVCAYYFLLFGLLKKTVLQMNEDKIHSIVLDEPKPQTKRTIAPRELQKTTKTARC